jgi:hypothetical protein
VNVADSGNSGLDAPEIESVNIQRESFNHVLLSQLRQMTQTAGEAGQQRLEACYHAALLRGQVYRQLVPPLARTLAADGPDYLPHLLAHIAYSHSAQFRADGQQHPGAYVKLAVQEHALGDPACLPPAGLGFEAALAWALRGGQAEAADPEPEPEAAPEPVSPLAEPIPTPAGPQSPHDIWQAALGRLQLELNKGVFDTWVRPATVLSYAPEPETFELGVPHIYARDFLELRLRDQVRRALGEVVGRAVKVRVSVGTHI